VAEFRIPDKGIAGPFRSHGHGSGLQDRIQKFIPLQQGRSPAIVITYAIIHQNPEVMNIIRKLLLAVTVSGLLICSPEFGNQIRADDPPGKDTGQIPAEKVTVTLPFDAISIGTYVSADPEAACGDCPVNEEGQPAGPECWVRVINEGEGTEINLGNFTHHFEFCADWINGTYPSPKAGAPKSVGYFEDDNGDRMYIMSAGTVYEGRLEEHPEYVNSWWRDPWEITGGTGRFEGATGSGMTDDYNSDLDPYSHHHWKGTITLVKGKE
jgi:hypothetical protein